MAFKRLLGLKVMTFLYTNTVSSIVLAIAFLPNPAQIQQSAYISVRRNRKFRVIL
ncbi:hypothetical protein MBAV_006142 [Candidatus Magnetobacterium bavaricum]|uniref:Uncharacterized protein n=1 Tax=Candidatus Magnetobacterium bavaricum TaxID=29290 RepID=A0A0F3GLT5_9BACT|nr:hypothetical protein MBAV_006142 [Candidatus Magnetobacterium bavaricum]